MTPLTGHPDMPHVDMGHSWRGDNPADSRAAGSSSRDIATPPTGPPSWGSKGVESQECPIFFFVLVCHMGEVGMVNFVVFLFCMLMFVLSGGNACWLGD